MSQSENQIRQIDRIATETSGVLRAIGEPIPKPSGSDDRDTQLRLTEARRRQLAERERFLKRYQPAIMAFIHTVLGDGDAVTHVWDGFVTKWLSGKLVRFDPNQGSFRKYLKTILRNDCRQFWLQRRRGKREVRLGSDYDQRDDLQLEAGKAFDRELKETILRRAISEVKKEDECYHSIVKYVMEASERDGRKPSTEALCRHLFVQTGRETSLINVRQLKKRAKDCLSEKLIEQVGLAIDSSVVSEIEEALSDLDLLRFCRAKIVELRK